MSIETIKSAIVTDMKTAKKNIFFAVFLIYRMIGDYITGGTFSINLFLVPLLVFLSAVSSSQESKHTLFQKHSYLIGGVCAACSAILIFNLCPTLPWWDDTSGAYLGIFLVSISCFRREHKKLIIVETISMSVFLTRTVSAALIGLTDSRVLTLRGIIRSGLGYPNPNGLSIDLFYLLALLYMGGFIRSRIVQGLLTFGFAAFIWYIPYTRTVCMLCLLFIPMLFLEWLQKSVRRNPKVIRLITFITDSLTVLAFPLIGICMLGAIFVLPKQYGFVARIDEILGDRVSLASNLISKHGVTAFGSLFQADRAGSTEIEYATMLVRIGVVGLVIFGIFWIWLSIRCLRAGRRRLLYMLAAFALYGASERNMLTAGGNIFMFLALSDLSTDYSSGESESEMARQNVRNQILATAASCLPAVAVLMLLPIMFNRMRTILQLEPSLYNNTFLLRRIELAFFLLFVFAWGLSRLLRNRVIGENPSKRILAYTGILGFIILIHLAYGEYLTGRERADVQALIDADAPAIETILSAKSGSLYVDPYPMVYRKRYPSISCSVLYGKDLARKRNATVLTDIMLDGSGTFESQGFHYAPVSDAHAVYTNDEAVIVALSEAGYTVTPYFSQRIHLDLEKCAQDSYLVYEPAFPGIYIDQTTDEYSSLYPWTNYNEINLGSYEVTFTCRLLLPEENTPDETCILAINYAGGDEFMREVITPSDADENGRIKKSMWFNWHLPSEGMLFFSYSVYGGNMRRLIVEDISYVRVG